ncbi:DUF7344 domain-containing protein [Natronomonas halophila]|uniref:DUF7344 domain-containing protein n=1 Tax=Natronomonas halophila TaxID=2747817 RepID=UPI001BADF7FF|nr:hypothetical protein [Natronomonas halophila]
MNEVSASDEVLPAEIQDGEADSESMADEAGETDDSRVESLPLDQVFGILKNQRRRYVLKYLYEAEERVSLSEVAEQIAAWENDKDVRQISSSERKRVYVGLYQCHLPKMDGVGVISFNKPRGVIELGENADSLYRYLDTDDEADEPPWHVYSVALSLAGALVLGVALLLQPMTTVPVVDLAVATAILAFSTYSIANISWLRRNDEEDADDAQA